MIKSENQRLAVHSFEMAELIPMLARDMSQRQIVNVEEDSVEDVALPHDCSDLQGQAFAAGKVAGIEEGKRQCRLEVDQETQRALMLVEQMAAARAHMLQQVESDVVALALAIAKKVIHREVSMHKEVVVEQVNHIFKQLSTASGVSLHVHPDDVDSLQTLQGQLTTLDGTSPPIRIESDPAIEVGGCILQTEGLYIDAGIESQLKIIGEALQPEGESDEPVEPSPTS
ncbi:FliH/SctL family protein [Nitrospira sp. M1]